MYFRPYVNVGAASDVSFMQTLQRGVEATKLLNHNELRLNIWKSDTEITVIMSNYGRAQSLLRRCMKTKADTREKEPLISRLLMICEPQSFISAALISSPFYSGSVASYSSSISHCSLWPWNSEEREKKVFGCPNHTPMLALNNLCGSENQIWVDEWLKHKINTIFWYQYGPRDPTSFTLTFRGEEKWSEEGGWVFQLAIVIVIHSLSILVWLPKSQLKEP